MQAVRRAFERQGRPALVPVCVLLALPQAAASQSTIVYVADLAGRVGTVNITTGTSTLIGNSGEALLDIGVTSSGVLDGVDGNSLYLLSRTPARRPTVGTLGNGYG